MICFIEAPHQFSLETKAFAGIEDTVGLSALCDLPTTFFEIFRKSFRIFSVFCFSRGVRLSKMGVLLFPEKMVSEIYAYPSGFFGTTKLMKF